MKTLQVAITEKEVDNYHFQSSQISFDELKEKISTKLAKDALLKCHQIAEETGLSKMTLAEINNEIAAVRSNANFIY
ncbi:MAG: hypothetical protein KGZ58_05970 [Ignavibacteriales bacterium]|nr:hypothetical protein [Ignavibacteriales bacterium]